MAGIGVHDSGTGVHDQRNTESCLAAAGENVLLAVNVRNGGSETWPSTDKSGITLGNHWLDIDGNTVKWKDGCVPLPLDLTPGSTARLDLLVTAPDVPGRYRLELDLAEEGIIWFKDKGSQTTSIDVEVNGGDEGRHITVAEDGFPLPSSDSPRLAFPLSSIGRYRSPHHRGNVRIGDQSHSPNRPTGRNVPWL